MLLIVYGINNFDGSIVLKKNNFLKSFGVYTDSLGCSRLYLTGNGKTTFYIGEAALLTAAEAENRAKYATLNSRNGYKWKTIKLK